MNEAILTVKGIAKSFGPKVVLQDVTFELHKGEILALFGGSGSGKSLILRSLIGLERPDQGSIVFEGKDITKIDELSLVDTRTKISYVFQNGALFDSMTVEMNLAYPLAEHTSLTNDEIRNRVSDILALIGLKGAEQLMPASLSGGMQKRVGVARAIIINPKIILYDEPTAGLDPANTQKLLDLMKQIQSVGEWNTAIFVTHDIPSAFQVADRIAFLYNGRIRAIDTVDNIKNTKDEVVRAFLSGEEFQEANP